LTTQQDSFILKESCQQLPADLKQGNITVMGFWQIQSLTVSMIQLEIPWDMPQDGLTTPLCKSMVNGIFHLVCLKKKSSTIFIGWFHRQDRE